MFYYIVYLFIALPYKDQFAVLRFQLIFCVIKHNLTSKNTIRQFPSLLSLSLMAFFLFVAKELDSTQSYYHYLKLEVCKEKQFGLRDFLAKQKMFTSQPVSNIHNWIVLIEVKRIEIIWLRKIPMGKD